LLGKQQIILGDYFFVAPGIYIHDITTVHCKNIHYQTCAWAGRPLGRVRA